MLTASHNPKEYNGYNCLLYTSDAADERSSVDLGGRRIIKKKKYKKTCLLYKPEKKHNIIQVHSIQR